MAIEGKIPASGPISFGAVRGILGENDPNYACYVHPEIIRFYTVHLLRLPEEGGAMYWQSILENGVLTLAEIELYISSSNEAQIVAATGGPIAASADATDYNMNRDMFRVITKSNSNQPIKASDLRSKDNSYKEYNSPWLLDARRGQANKEVKVTSSDLSPPLFLNNYFDGDQFTGLDAIKATVYSHYNEGFVGWSSFGRDVINFFIRMDNYYDSGFVLNSAGGGKAHYSGIVYDPSDRSIKIKAEYGYSKTKSGNVHCSLIRIEYIPHQIHTNFYQYYDAGIDDFKANHD